MDPGIQMVHGYPYAICSKDHLTVLQCIVTGHKSKDSLCLCLFIDSLFHSIGLFTFPCTKATMIKIRLEVRLYKSSNFVHPQECLGYSQLFVFFIKIYNQLFLILRGGSSGVGSCITICWYIFSVK